MSLNLSATSRTLTTPVHATALAFDNGTDVLAVGSDDGSFRLYKLPEVKVVQAVRGLGDSVSSIACDPGAQNSFYIAAGRQVLYFVFDNRKLVYTSADASRTITLGEDDSDAVNQIALNGNRSYIAFTTDNGTVGVVDLSTNDVKRMKTRHQSIAWAVSFIPDRPNELVSGGYDCALLHFDFKQGTLLSRFDIPATPAIAPGISRSPPFITSLSVSPAGAIAAGTAEGRVWVGLGGEKRAEDVDHAASAKSGKKKRSRKWNGLSNDEGAIVELCEGIVPGILFVSSDSLLISSLGGEVTSYSLNRSPSANQAANSGTSLSSIVSVQSLACAKVNALARNTSGWCVVAGLDKSGEKGIVEFWKEE